MQKVPTETTKQACSERRTGTTADIRLQSHTSAGTGRKMKQLARAKTKTRTDKLALPQLGLLRRLLDKCIKALLQQRLLFGELGTQVTSMPRDSSGTRATRKLQTGQCPDGVADGKHYLVHKNGECWLRTARCLCPAAHND